MTYVYEFCALCIIKIIFAHALRFGHWLEFRTSMLSHPVISEVRSIRKSSDAPEYGSSTETCFHPSLGILTSYIWECLGKFVHYVIILCVRAVIFGCVMSEQV